jgi:hypothetical protein
MEIIKSNNHIIHKIRGEREILSKTTLNHKTVELTLFFSKRLLNTLEI